MRVLAAIFAFALLAPVAAQEGKKKYKVLYITQSKGFTHGSVKRKTPDELAPSEVSMTELARDSGLFDVECTQDASILTPEKLRELDVVMFYTTGNLPISEPNFAAFLDWLKSGKAFVAIHSATDTYHNYKPFYELINGTFAGHPWGSGTTVTITNHEPGHVTTKMFDAEFQFKDEIYQYRNYDPKAVRVLYSLNMAKCKPQEAYHVPVCWVRESGKGRMFYTNLGHNEATWQNPKFKEHLLAGIRWALKLEEGHAGPNPEVSYLEDVKAFASVAAADKAEALIAAARKLDVQQLEKLAAEVAAFRKMDKKDAVKRAAEVKRIVALIEKN